MNANLPMVLTFGLAPKPSSTLRVICIRNNVQLVKIEPAQCGEVLGVLCGMDAPAGAAAGDALAEPMLVFANMTLAAVQKFLNEARAAKFVRPSLMAMLTDTNRSWTPAQLQEQLMEERTAVKEKMQSIHERSGHDHDHHSHEHAAPQAHDGEDDHDA